MFIRFFSLQGLYEQGLFVEPVFDMFIADLYDINFRRQIKLYLEECWSFHNDQDGVAFKRAHQVERVFSVPFDSSKHAETSKIV